MVLSVTKAFKALNKDMTNYKGNTTYTTNKWYWVPEVNTDQTEYYIAYGLNLFDDPIYAQLFIPDGIIYLCYVPVENNKITIISDRHIIRCQQFYLTDDIITITDYINYWNTLTKKQRIQLLTCNTIIITNILNTVGWNNLNIDQQNMLCGNTQVAQLIFDNIGWVNLDNCRQNNLCKSIPLKIFNEIGWNNINIEQQIIIRSRFVIQSDKYIKE